MEKDQTLARLEIKRANDILERTKDEKNPDPDELKDAFEHILWAISFSENVHETIPMIEAAKTIYSQVLDMIVNAKGEVKNEGNN